MNAVDVWMWQFALLRYQVGRYSPSAKDITSGWNQVHGSREESCVKRLDEVCASCFDAMQSSQMAPAIAMAQDDHGVPIQVNIARVLHVSLTNAHDFLDVTIQNQHCQQRAQRILTVQPINYNSRRKGIHCKVLQGLVL